MAVECQAVHAGRCPTPQWSRPLARMRSPRLLTATLGFEIKTRRKVGPIRKRDRKKFAGAEPGRMSPAFSSILLLSLLFSPVVAEAQQAAKIARIGWLAGNMAASPQLPEAFRQGLRDLGYVEGRNVVIEYRDAEGKFERLPALAAELVALKVDVIVAGGTPQALAAKQATRTVPIVFAAAGDPVTSGLVTSLARPGGNVTGLTGLGPELVGKGLEQLTQAVPGVSRVAVLWQPGGQGERTDKDILTAGELRQGLLGHDQGARGCSDCPGKPHVLR
jgi:hypothetical protein